MYGYVEYKFLYSLFQTEVDLLAVTKQPVYKYNC